MTALLAAAPATGFDQLVAGLVPHSFASADDVAAMAATLAARIGAPSRLSGTHEGQRAYLRLSPGTVALRIQTVAGMDEHDGDHADRAARGLDAATGRAGYLEQTLDLEDDDSPRAITEWSPASRRRMVRTLAELDYSQWSDEDGCLAMVTLTLPGWWEVLTPTGADFKRLLRAFEQRWRRAVGPWRGLWKLEFQHRGAPHAHLLLRVPAFAAGQVFEQWLARTWADVCLDSLADRDALAYIGLGEYDRHLSAGTGVDFSGVKFSDPRRTAIYFLKHSTKTKDGKEYQHIVPAIWQHEGSGPGRFWGYAGLSRAVAEVEVTWSDFVQLRRVLRHVTRAAAARAEIQRRRSAGESLWTMPRPRRRGFGCTGGGWVLVNDGLALAHDVGRLLAAP